MAHRMDDQVTLERTPPQCDRRGCPAAALVIVELRPGLQLALCGHDYTDNEALLAVHGWKVVADTRNQLRTRESRVGGLV